MKFTPSEKRLWLIASLCGLVGMVLILALFRIPGSSRPKDVAPVTPKVAGSETVGLARLDDRDANSRLRDEALLHSDSAVFAHAVERRRKCAAC